MSEETLAEICNAPPPAPVSADEQLSALRDALPALVWQTLKERGLVAGEHPVRSTGGAAPLSDPIVVQGEPLSRSLIRDRR